MPECLVTGISAGIGQAVAKHFAKQGWRTWGCSRVAPSETSWNPFWEHADVRDFQSVYTWMRGVCENLGYLPSVLVMNAAINYLAKWGSLDLMQFEDVIQTNLMGYVNTLEAYVRLKREMKPCPQGPIPRVVFVGSVAAEIPMRNTSSYNATKAANHMLMQQAARELSPEFVCVEVSPGRVANTRMSAQVDEAVMNLRGWSIEETQKYQLQAIPMGRIVSMDEVAKTVLWAAVNAPDMISGSTITVGGGVR